MNQGSESNGSAFGSGEGNYQTLTEAMTYDCNRPQHQNNYAMQGLNMLDSSPNYAMGQHGLEMYSSDYHNFQTDQSYYQASNSDLMLSYDGHDGPSSSGLNVGQYFNSVDPMMMVQQSQQSQGYGGGSLDYTDVNNLEPSLVPEHVDAMQSAAANPQQTQLHQQQMQHGSNGLVSMMSTQPRHVQQPMAAYVANYYNASYHSSPTGSSHTSSGTDISDEGDDMFGLSPYKRSPTGEMDYRNVKGKRQGKKRKPRKDPNEPQKPVSAYALFFRDTQAAIKGQNPNASFGEVSKIVASMWDSLGSDAKNIYKQKTESAKKEYLKQLAAYRANLLSKGNRGCMAMDPFAELAAQQRKASMQAQSTSSPDSTTSNAVEQKDPCTEIGAKTLASLIAEPAPQQVLTATTTLTVPQSYTSARTKGDYSLEMDGGNPLCIRTSGCHQKQSVDEQPHWEREYVDDCVAKNCRDMYSGWVPARQAQQQAAGAYAPV